MKQDSDPHGWRSAAFIVVLALALTAGAYAIHAKTFCDPIDPTCRKIGPAAVDHGTDAAHGADSAHSTDSTRGADTTHRAADSTGSPNTEQHQTSATHTGSN
jgi:hypothetical protein